MLRPSIFGWLLDDRLSFQVVGQALQDRSGPVPDGRHFAAAEHDGDLHLVASVEEAQARASSGGVVAHVDLGTELHFLRLDLALVLAGLLGLDGLIVLELASSP